MDPFFAWLEGAPLSVWLREEPTLMVFPTMGEFMRTSTWAWPTFESLHFIGMSLLAGTIVMFDLRLLGFARAVPVSALHRLIPFGIGGFLLNMTAGSENVPPPLAGRVVGGMSLRAWIGVMSAGRLLTFFRP